VRSAIRYANWSPRDQFERAIATLDHQVIARLGHYDSRFRGLLRPCACLHQPGARDHEGHAGDLADRPVRHVPDATPTPHLVLNEAHRLPPVDRAPLRLKWTGISRLLLILFVPDHSPNQPSDRVLDKRRHER
jgi:hypothetical protein